MKSSFDIVHVNDHAVFIVDLDGNVSVTNDAEDVVINLLTKFGDKRIIYRDTMGNWDELCHNETKFTHFMSLQPDDPASHVIDHYSLG